MRFCEYFEVIKNNYAKSISNDALCLQLFDSVIEPLRLTNSNGELVSYGKQRLYEFARGERPVPGIIRDNVYEPKVVSKIVDYFDQYIVSELVPNREDICYQIMRLVEEDEAIAPETKANLQMIAKPDTVALLLAQTFGYAIRENLGISFRGGLDNKNSVRKSELCLMGIDGTSLVPDTFFVEHFKPFSDDFISDSLTRIENIFKRISDIHLAEYNFNSCFGKGWFSTIDSKLVEISAEEQAYITNMANALKIDLPDDFFALGDLRRNPLKSANILVGGSDLDGSKEAQKKYSLINKLEKELDSINRWIPIKASFSKLYCIRLALLNRGNNPDEDIIITLEFDSGMINEPSDLLKFDKEMLDDLLDDFDVNDFFGISTTKNYFNYSDSRAYSKRPESVGALASSIFVRNNDIRSIKEIKKELEEAFGYQFIKEDGKTYVILKYDRIMHNTAIAFPEVLFVSEEIKEIRYTIRSRNMENYYLGIITREDNA